MQDRTKQNIGKKLGRLLVLRLFRKGGESYADCLCDCGRSHTARIAHLKNGTVRSCGCLVKELCKKRQTTHGMSNSREYQSWLSMRQRCNNPRSHCFEQYGARGIKVCNRWESFKNFYEDMGARAKGKTIDRINNDRGYCPENCRWATATEQSKNRRVVIRIKYNGQSKTLREWAEELGVTTRMLQKRHIRGWSDEKIIETPKLREGGTNAT